ncbi:hypothetical protein TRAPUB_131 [Trametes pubescens]|uniref:Uncharacterized protein n=1 Tax=Trametes pubescens TaxID=154538 RepID=A0A1M2VN36_TRAPU|nr:hypothetical protein TRAPUB_131 [Trametes pubescens]
MARIYGAYVVHGAEPFGPILFFADLKSPLSLVWAACYVFEAFITDSLTIYRLYVIWGSNIWVCIPPGLCVGAMLVSGFGTVISFSKLDSGNDLWTNVAGDWLICAFVLGLATNILAVSLIGYRILVRNRRVTAVSGVGSLKNVVVVIIESAALYTFLKTINLVLLLTKSNVAWAFLSIANPIIGIASHLLILRVAWMRHFKPATSHSAMTSPSRAGTYPMRVQVTTDRVNDDDLEASTMKGGDDKLTRSGNW